MPTNTSCPDLIPCSNSILLMKTVTLSEFLKKPELYLDMVPIAVKTLGKKKFVIVDASEFRSMSETLHLTSTIANTEHLMKSIRQAEGKS